MSMWEDVKRNLRDLYAVTSDKTVEMAKMTPLQYDKWGISRDIERQFSELGNLVYTGVKAEREDILEDPQVQGLLDRLDALELELKAKSEEISAIRNFHRNRQEPDAQDEPAAPGAVDDEPAAGEDGAGEDPHASHQGD